MEATPPVAVALLLSLLTLLAGGWSVSAYTSAHNQTVGYEGTAAVFGHFCFALGLFLIPGCIAARMLMSSAAEAVASGLLGPVGRQAGANVQALHYGKARALAAKGCTIAAAREFRRYYEENPGEPKPLFAAATLLTRKKFYDEAEKMYRDILSAFDRDAGVWSEAACLLANLLETERRNKAAAEQVLRELALRAPRTEPGRAALQRLSA